MAAVSQVSKASNVHTEDVYEIPPKLEKIVLIDRMLGKPARIRADSIRERELHMVLDIPAMAICVYNIQMLTEVDSPIDLYNELVRTHNIVLFAGIDNELGKIEIRTAQTPF